MLYLEGHGGDTSNAAIAAARQGARVGYITAIGQDRPATRFMALWAARGCGYLHGAPQRRSRRPRSMSSPHDAGGHPSPSTAATAPPAAMAPRDVPEAAIRAARILHVSGISQAISTSACDAVFHAIAVAKAAGVKRLLRHQPPPRALAAGAGAAVIHAAIAQADIALPSLDDARVLTGLEAPEAIADFYLRLGCPHGAAEEGQGRRAGGDARGPARADPALPRRRRWMPPARAMPSPAPSWPASWPGDDAGSRRRAYANAAAALSTTGYGAVAPIPHRGGGGAAAGSG